MENEIIKNATQKPRLYYGLHMIPGIAEYRDKGKRTLVRQDAIDRMNPSFQGVPLYVNHTPKKLDDNLATLSEADGMVIRSFFNPADGMTWCEFMATTDKAHQAISNGWTLSNSYQVVQKSGAGRYIDVDYSEEIIEADADHMALVPDPRYEFSQVLTAEQFRTYNSEKETERERLSNSKGDLPMKSVFEFFTVKREKLDNAKSAEFADKMVLLPKSKKEVSLERILNAADEGMMSGAYANGDHMVKVGDEEMSVNSLVEKHSKFAAYMKKNDMSEADLDAESPEAGQGGLPQNSVEEEKKKKDEAEKVANEAKEKEGKEKEEKERKENAKKASEARATKAAQDLEAKRKADMDAYEILRNAKELVPFKKLPVDGPGDGLERGKARY